MLKGLGRVALTLAVGSTVMASAASATVYVNKRYCGGAVFATCAAVMLDVTGSTVTLRLWNLSGNTANSYGNVTNAGSVFLGIGIFNVPPSIDAVNGSLVTSNNPANRIGAPAPWGVGNNSNVGFLVDIGLLKPGTGAANGLASGCATAGQLPAVALYVNPCSDPSTAPLSDWLTFTFQVDELGWDATNADFSIRYRNTALGGSECWTGTTPSGAPANCYQVTPEPMTMTLLATGLVGLGGIGYLRRRRNAAK